MADQQSGGSKKLNVDLANVSFMARLRRATRLSICPLIGHDQKFPADRQNGALTLSGNQRPLRSGLVANAG
jgi:hypothetical protein